MACRQIAEQLLPQDFETVDVEQLLNDRQIEFLQQELQADPFGQAGGGLFIVAEIPGQAETLPRVAENFRAEAVQGRDLSLLEGLEMPAHGGRCTQQPAVDALVHLRRGFLREGQGQDPLHTDIRGFQEPAVALGDHRGLPRTGAGHHHGVVLHPDRCGLSCVEADLHAATRPTRSPAGR